MNADPRLRRRGYVLAVEVAELSRGLEFLAALAYVHGHNASTELGSKVLQRVAKGKRVPPGMGDPRPNPYDPATLARQEQHRDTIRRLQSEE